MNGGERMTENEKEENSQACNKSQKLYLKRDLQTLDDVQYKNFYLRFSVRTRDIRIRDPPIVKAILKLMIGSVMCWIAIQNQLIADKVLKFLKAAL